MAQQSGKTIKAPCRFSGHAAAAEMYIIGCPACKASVRIKDGRIAIHIPRSSEDRSTGR